MQKLFQTGEIFTSLALEIRELINVEVIIANVDGMIIACTKNERLNQFHEGAYLSMKKGQDALIKKDLSEGLLGVQEGIIIPLYLEQIPVGVLGITGDPDIVKYYAPIVRRLSVLYLKNAIEQFSREQTSRNIELFFYDWLNGNLSEQQLEERSTYHQINIEKYCQVISVNLPFKTDVFTFKDLNSFKNKLYGNRETKLIRWGAGKILILDEGMKREELEQKLSSFKEKLKVDYDNEVYIGVGQILTHRELTKSFKQAEEACTIAQSEKRIVFEEDLRFEMIQYEIENQTKELFVKRTIAPLLTESLLLETLDQWLGNNMSIQKTAKALKIHKNTLYYRLDKIMKMTNLDLNDINHIVLLYMSNRFLHEFD